MHLVVFLFLLGVAACSVEHRTVASLPGTADVAMSARPTLEESLAAYESRLDALKARALTTGQISYAQVVEAAYTRAMLPPKTIARKRWSYLRENKLRFTDYSRLRITVPVQEEEMIRGSTPGSRLWGQYNFKGHRMHIDETAHANVIIHEAGHVLQRRELIDRRKRGRSVANSADVDRVQSAAKEGMISTSKSARLCYLIRQDELDVRLQDLNRFFANCVSARPILSPQDSLRALYALGIDISAGDVSAACLAGNLVGVTAIEDPVVIFDGRVGHLFDDASELRELCYWSKRTGTELWPELLARILREAPHHF